eukprot:349490_1
MESEQQPMINEPIPSTESNDSLNKDDSSIVPRIQKSKSRSRSGLSQPRRGKTPPRTADNTSSAELDYYDKLHGREKASEMLANAKNEWE